MVFFINDKDENVISYFICLHIIFFIEKRLFLKGDSKGVFVKLISKIVF